MPYGNITELPQSVRDALPKHGQDIFLAAFNSAIEQGKDEETAFKISWGAVKKLYEKGTDDIWKKIGNLQFFSNIEYCNKEHDVVLERLNQKLHYKDHGFVYYPTQLFQDFGNAWEGVPIVFGTNHPDMNVAVKDNIVGTITAPKVELSGTPRFMAKFKIDNPIIENLIMSGKLAHSTGFFGNVDANNQLISMIPHHVLVFVQDDKNNPRDTGAMILNKEDNMATKDYSKEDIDAMLDFMKANPGMMDKTPMDKMYAAMDGTNQKEYMKGVLKDLQSHPEMMDDEMKSMMKGMNNKETIDTMGKEDELSKQLEISNKEKETLTGEIEGFKKLIADKDAQLKVFEQREAEALKVTRESQWQTIKNKIPVGLTHKAEDEAKLRAEFESDPYGFAVKLTEFKNSTGTQKDGVEFSQQETDEDAKTKQGFTVGGTYTIGD